MKFLLDENVDRRLAPFLREKGHDVTIVGEEYPASLKDDEVLALATHEQRILLTNDVSDFGALIFSHHYLHCGVLLLRFKLQEANIDLKKQRLHYVLSEYAEQLHHFLVVTPESVKVRATQQRKQAA